jgi:hypothetical protein
MTIHVKMNHNATALGQIGFNMDEIHMMAGVAAGASVILSGIGLYQHRQKQKASIEDVALFLSILAILLSGTYI